MGHARFFIDAKPKRRHRYLFANKKTFTTISDEPGGKRTTTKVEASSKAELLALCEAGCRQAIAEGWKDFTFNGWEVRNGLLRQRRRRFWAEEDACASALAGEG